MKKELELVLAKLKALEKPKVALEQYTIPASLAAEIINIAYISGDIKGKLVLDAGCGSGRLAIGAAIAGAKKVVGIDVDPDAISQAKENLKIAESLVDEKLNVEFVCKPIEKWDKKCDTVLQNPPFGIKSKQKDRTFLEKAMSVGKKVYSLHRDGREDIRKFISNVVAACNCSVESIFKLRFFLPHTFKFHKKPKIRYDVDLYVIRC